MIFSSFADLDWRPIAAIVCLAFFASLLYTRWRYSSRPSLSYEAGHNDAAAHRDTDCGTWSSLDGRYKHCMLRADPFSPWDPPRYSLTNLDLPLPVLAPGELDGVVALEKRVEDLAAAGQRTDRMTLLRFLRAKFGDVVVAEKYFRESIRYRDEINLNQMDTNWDLAAYEKCFSPWWVRGGILGHSLNGGIIGYERLGRCRFPDLMDMLPWDVLRRLDAVHMVRTLAAFEEDSMRRGVPYDNAILVLDLEGLDMSYCKPRIARAFGKLVEIRDMLMPNTVVKIFVIRAPSLFSFAWKLVKPLLDVQIRDKVSIVSSQTESLKVLRQYMSDDVIPAYIGGGLRIQGDPECRLAIGASGDIPVPKEEVERLLDLIAHNGGEDANGAARSAKAKANEAGCLCGVQAFHARWPRRRSS